MTTDAVSRAVAARAAYIEAGNEVVERRGARFARNLEHALVHDANLAIATDPDLDPEAVVHGLDELYPGMRHRKAFVGPDAPPELSPLLVLAGYAEDADVELVLPAGDDLEPVTRSPAEIRPFVLGEDEASLVALTRLDHAERTERLGIELWSMAVTEQIVAVRLAKAPAVQFFLASVDGRDVGYFSAFPGVDGTGIVENLFTHRDVRGRGVGRALVAHCVADARTRGAGEVLIGAEPGDWPKGLYVHLGFRPLCLLRTFSRTEREART